MAYCKTIIHSQTKYQTYYLYSEMHKLSSYNSGS